ncbi:hypothetical protein DY000_02029870 [Brassica cretica]|uniref:Uncharacterized protein n=1 Tax=Brassica cretica TaxID=69181 RepID=A0ABQ7E028_BRACR|nr:hypothetical protein DY000_02029870 [Brassica cretica]
MGRCDYSVFNLIVFNLIKSDTHYNVFRCFAQSVISALNKEKGPLPSFKPAKSGGGMQKKLRKAKQEGEQLFLFDDKLRSEAPMFKLTKPSILADRLLPVVVRRLKHRGIWGRKRKRENKGYLPNMKTSKRISMALYIVNYFPSGMTRFIMLRSIQLHLQSTLGNMGASGKHPPSQSTLFRLHSVTPFCTSKYLSFISMFHVGVNIVGGWKVKPERSASGVQPVC